MRKIYKYTSVSSAIAIIKKESVLLNNPNNFNDPYDCLYNYDAEDYEKTKKIYLDFLVIKAFEQICDEIYPNLKSLDRVVVSSFKESINLLQSALSINPFYEEIQLCSKILRIIYDKVPDIGSKIDKRLLDFRNVLDETIRGFRNDSLVSCFSGRKDSILMWSHYANSHKGVCMEFDFPNDRAFQNVSYSTEVPSMKIYKMMSHIFALRIMNKNIDKLDESLNFNEILEPFYTKSKEWSYEEEIRCLYSRKEINDNIFLNDEGKYVLKMALPTAIYIGTKSEGNELDELIRLANNRGIPIFFMKIDDHKFSIVEDKDKIYEPKQKAKVKEVTLNRIKNDINNCLDNGAYLAAFATALIIPTICSKVEIKEEISEKEKYIKWCNEYLTFSQKNPDGQSPYLSGEMCWKIKEQLFTNGNIDVHGQYEDFYLEDIKLIIDGRNYLDLYVSVKENNIINQSVCEFCSSMIAQAERCFEKNKTDIEQLRQIEIENYDERMDEIKEHNIRSKKQY